MATSCWSTWLEGIWTMNTLRPHDDESICIPSSTAARPLFPRLLLCPAPQRSSRFLLMSPPFLLFPLPLLPNPIAVARLLSDVAPCLLFPVPLLPRPIPVEQLHCNSGLTGKRSRRVGGREVNYDTYAFDHSCGPYARSSQVPVRKRSNRCGEGGRRSGNEPLCGGRREKGEWRGCQAVEPLLGGRMEKGERGGDGKRSNRCGGWE